MNPSPPYAPRFPADTIPRNNLNELSDCCAQEIAELSVRKLTAAPAMTRRRGIQNLESHSLRAANRRMNNTLETVGYTDTVVFEKSLQKLQKHLRHSNTDKEALLIL
jgi:hypothetical protein